MTCNDLRRPTEIQCACGAVVRVGRLGRLPWRCAPCAREHRRARERGESVPRRPAHLEEDARELGPERPLLGMTAEDLHTWKLQRAVRLYRVEDLGVTLISERLGLATRSIYQALAEAGLEAKHEKRLPAGLPVA